MFMKRLWLVVYGKGEERLWGYYSTYSDVHIMLH